MTVLLAALCRDLARLAAWANRVLTQQADEYTRAHHRAQDTKDHR